jgi:sulfane dehydrogenase subunit SoxC
MAKRDTEDRRRFLALGAALAGGLAGCSKDDKKAATADEEEPSQLGAVVRKYGERSPHETVERLVPETRTPEAASSRTPLADQYGMITPSSLHFERNHSGVPDLDPARHSLMIHGLVDRPLVFSLDELKRLPSVSRVHFVECAGNSGSEWGVKNAPDVQRSHGLASCSEWTGVLLKLLLEEAGLKKEANWLVAEGADACKLQRSVPVGKALDDALVVYGQNGEALRPENGYPLRLLVPGFEGNMNVKWLRRIKAVPEPVYARDETSKYTELMADGKAWIFTFPMDAKSVITRPSGGQKLAGPGFYEIRGLAWSGRGRIRKVDVSTDGGKTWKDAQLQDPVLPKAFTPFRLAWNWDGKESVLVCRCTDDTGYVQPDREELVASRGMNSSYHCNVRKAWRVNADGSVKNA